MPGAATAAGSVLQTRARGQQHTVGVVFLFVTLVIDACVSMRGAARVLAVVQDHWGLEPEVPDWTTGRSWLMRVGYYKLMRPKEQADDWVWFIDHSCQIGADKCLVILGVRLLDLPPRGECLRLEHLEPLEVLPVRSSTQEEVAKQLRVVAAKVGVPRAIVRDDGADLRGGVALFRAEHPATADIDDIKHKTACLLRHVLEADERWSEFNRHVGTRYKQVSGAANGVGLSGPADAAYQSSVHEFGGTGALGRGDPEISGWTARRRDAARHGRALGSEVGLAAALPGLRHYRAALAEWSELMAVTQVAEDFVRRQGLYVGAAWDLAKRRPPGLAYGRAQQLWQDLVKHVSKQTAQIRPGERLPGSTEALESCFGKLKQLEKEQNRSGFTGLLLGLGAVVSRTTAQVVRAALESCPLKKVWGWCKRTLGTTVQSQRRLAYAGLRRPTSAIETG